jgi:Alpha-L-fucosidase
MLARSLLTIALGGFLLALLALRGAQAQSPTAPTASIDPEAIDAIWQKAKQQIRRPTRRAAQTSGCCDHHGPFRPDWESLQKYEAPEWYKDAKFGIFIHWGVYSVPAFGNEWYPRSMYSAGSDEYKHHIATYGTQDKFGYKDFIPMFKAADFNAAALGTVVPKIRRPICCTGGGASRRLCDV